VVSGGQAECGVTAPPFASVSVAKGARQTIVMPVVQKPLGSLAVQASSKYRRPADLDGATYGGFGSPGDEELIRAIIREDGGKGEFRYVNLTTGTTEALFAGRVDFINAYVNNQPIEAELRGKPLRVFPYADFGIPAYPGVVVACNDAWLQENGEVAKRFVTATAQGWEAVQADPAAAAQVLFDENPGAFATDRAKEAQRRSLAKMAAEGLIVNADGRAGCLAVDQLAALGERLEEIGFYRATGVDPAPDFTKIATGAYQPEACTTP
jgi:ABC-type nitrate/sulfonate/bicarbonate transport system substrate-binding protein